MFRWRRRKFKAAMRKAVAAIPEMELTSSQVSVLTFREAGGYDGEIHVRFTFNDIKKRTPDVREILAEKIAIVVDEWFPETKWWLPRIKWFPRTSLIEVWGNPFPKENGFHFIKRERWYC